MSRAARVARLLTPDANPARHVDGIITAGALLAAETAHKETLAEGAGAVAVSLVLVWLAHSYAEAMEQRLTADGTWSAGQLVRAARHELAVLRGAFIPLAVLLIAGWSGLGTRDAVLAALASAVAMLFLYELVGALRAQLTPAGVVGQVVVCVAIGAGILALKVILG
jgi:hypothetical protein